MRNNIKAGVSRSMVSPRRNRFPPVADYTVQRLSDIGPVENCLWNTEQRAHRGIDIVRAMLNHRCQQQNEIFSLVAIFDTAYPPRWHVDTGRDYGSLAHLSIPENAGRNIPHLTPADLIGSVHYSRFPGLWGVIFPLWCGYKAWKVMMIILPA